MFLQCDTEYMYIVSIKIEVNIFIFQKNLSPPPPCYHLVTALQYNIYTIQDNTMQFYLPSVAIFTTHIAVLVPQVSCERQIYDDIWKANGKRLFNKMINITSSKGESPRQSESKKW